MLRSAATSRVAGGLGRRGPAVVQSCAGSGGYDYNELKGRPAPAGLYKPENRAAAGAGWELPTRKEYGLTEKMVEELKSRAPQEPQLFYNDRFKDAHSLEGNFMHYQHPQDARFMTETMEGLRSPETADPHQARAVNHALGYKFRQSLGVVGLGVLSLYLVKNIAWGFISAKSPTRDKYVAGVSEVDTSKVVQGEKGILGTWRGKPIFIRHRSDKQVEKEKAVEVGSLRHPETDAQRHANGRPNWVVMVGVCTHLGCLPVAGEGEWGGYYCPCHGSHYDTAGRIRKGPAPLNLEIPEHEWKDDNTLVIGKL